MNKIIINDLKSSDSYKQMSLPSKLNYNTYENWNCNLLLESLFYFIYSKVFKLVLNFFGK